MSRCAKLSSMNEPTWNRHHPFLAKLICRELLCKPGSKKITYHLVISLEGSGITYEVGDSLGIYPTNDPILVERTLQAMHATGNEVVHDKEGKEHFPLREFLSRKANISDVSRKVLHEIQLRHPSSERKSFYADLLSDVGKERLKAYLEERELWDVLSENREVEFPIEELCRMLMPLLPRFYSIASSQKVVGDEIHLTVALLNYDSLGVLRKGVCTHFLCDLVPLNVPCIPLFIQPHKGFTTPEDPHQAMIMIGPGTGVAPFRAFLQERQAREALGKHWLFFGEWHRDYHFYYEDYWRALENQNRLRLHAAFSRDQSHKVYVQHQMLENGKELFAWLEEGAVLYVCGDAQQMAKDVEKALYDIIKEHGSITDEEVKAYIKRLRVEKRYLRDVY